jgi:hypothetical protein
MTDQSAPPGPHSEAITGEFMHVDLATTISREDSERMHRLLNAFRCQFAANDAQSSPAEGVGFVGMEREQSCAVLE